MGRDSALSGAGEHMFVRVAPPADGCNHHSGPNHRSVTHLGRAQRPRRCARKRAPDGVGTPSQDWISAGAPQPEGLQLHPMYEIPDASAHPMNRLMKELEHILCPSSVAITGTCL